MSEKEKQPLLLPSMSDFCLNEPLHKTFPFDDSNTKEINDMECFRGHIDCYCLECKQPSVFHPELESYRRRPTGFYIDRDLEFEVICYCTRDDLHRILFYFRIYENTITKIGQHPSMADLSTIDIQRYRKLLGSQRYYEFNRAVGLASEGVGIGSFVYLRRIFENLIEDAHKSLKNSDGWVEEQYQKSRMDKKILLLKDSLPSFLVSNKSLYSILSKGIHQLSEQECLGAFRVIKLGIELILDEKLEKLEHDRKIQEAQSDISDLTRRLKSKHT